MTHKEKVLLKIQARILQTQQETIKILLEQKTLTIDDLASAFVSIDLDLIEDLLRIQLGRNAHFIAKANDAA